MQGENLKPLCFFSNSLFAAIPQLSWLLVVHENSNEQNDSLLTEILGQNADESACLFLAISLPICHRNKLLYGTHGCKTLPRTIYTCI